MELNTKAKGRAIVATTFVIGSMVMASWSPTSVGAEVVVGQLTNLTGYGADGFGRPVNWGSQVGMEEVKAARIMGATQVTFKVVDDATDPTTAITELNKLTQQKISIVTETAISRICSALAPMAQQTKPPTLIICIGSSGTGPADAKPDFNYMNDPSGPMQSLARYAITKKGAKKIAVIYDTDNAGSWDAQSAYFQQGMKSAGVDGYISTQKVSSKDTDFASVLTNLKALAPDAIMFYATAAQSGNVIRQMAQMGGFEKVVKLGHIGWTGQVPQIAGSAATGGLFPQAWIPSAASKTFIDAYTKLSSGAQPTAYAALGHDTVWLLSVAIKLVVAEGKQPDGPTVQAKLTAASQSAEYKTHSLVKGLTFNNLGRTVTPGIITIYDASGALVAAP